MAFTMRDQTFITIHNLAADANILFASGSVRDILGYETHEVEQRSCFDFFHPDEIPFARSIHSRGVFLDKAAVLHYARIRHRDGHWVGCECCFTVVHNVLVACTSVYMRTERSEKRAIDAQQIRRIFSSSPRDPRYHMLEHLSPKFRMPPSVEREPRAALILNRFAATLPIMFATSAVAVVLGLEPRDVHLRPFYELMEEPCLRDAIRCLENAKANESIAYLRFWFRNPLAQGQGGPQQQQQEQQQQQQERNEGAILAGEGDEDQMMEDVGEEADGHATRGGDGEVDDGASHSSLSDDEGGGARLRDGSMPAASPGPAPGARQPRSPRQPSAPRAEAAGPAAGPERVELEAVVSCSSDGLVVVLRRARPAMPATQPSLRQATGGFENGFFAAPWAQRPMVPPGLLHNYPGPFRTSSSSSSSSNIANINNSNRSARSVAFNDLYQSIREMAVFAWALVGINGNLADFSQGQPLQGAQPPEGLPVWDPAAGSTDYESPDNQAYQRWGPPYGEEPATAASGSSSSGRTSGNGGGAPILQGESNPQQLFGETGSYQQQQQQPDQYGLPQQLHGHNPAGQHPSSSRHEQTAEFSTAGQASGGGPSSAQEAWDLARTGAGATRRRSPSQGVDGSAGDGIEAVSRPGSSGETARDVRNMWQ